MKIIRDLSNILIKERTSVAIGNFDGIHIGHIEVLKEAVVKANEQGLKSLCFTFSNHPFNYILGRKDTENEAVKKIISEDDKIILLENLGFDYLVNIPFDDYIMKMNADDFYNKILVEKFNSAYISVGFNFTYGSRAQGKPEDLIKKAKISGIGVKIHDAVMLENNVVSSTLIRNFIQDGDMESVYKYLGRHLSYSGIVVHGKKIGRRIGYKTLNLDVAENMILPPDGVYYSFTEIGDDTYESISNIGINPTVGTVKRRIETHLFNFSGDLYDNVIRVNLLHLARGEKKFGDIEELKRQIEFDCEKAIEYHKKMC